MARVKIRRAGVKASTPSPEKPDEFFFRLAQGDTWHVGIPSQKMCSVLMEPRQALRARCGELVYRYACIIRPAGGPNRCKSCWKDSTENVRTDIIEGNS